MFCPEVQELIEFSRVTRGSTTAAIKSSVSYFRVELRGRSTGHFSALISSLAAAAWSSSTP